MEKIGYWEKVIREQRASGKSIAAYCGEHGIRQSQFWYWNKELSKASKERPRKEFVPVGEQPKIEIVLKNGALLRLPLDCSAETMKNVLEALDAVGA